MVGWIGKGAEKGRMSGEELEKLVEEIHYYVTDNLPLSSMSDEELEEEIENLVQKRCSEFHFVYVEHRV